MLEACRQKRFFHINIIALLEACRQIWAFHRFLSFSKHTQQHTTAHLSTYTHNTYTHTHYIVQPINQSPLRKSSIKCHVLYCPIKHAMNTVTAFITILFIIVNRFEITLKIWMLSINWELRWSPDRKRLLNVNYCYHQLIGMTDHTVALHHFTKRITHQSHYKM